jgi:hypothetical protein
VIGMNEERKYATTATQLEFHASGFVTKVGGRWTETTLQEFRTFLSARRLTPSDDQLLAVLEPIRQRYLAGEYRLSVCSAQPCCNRLSFDISDGALGRITQDIGMPVWKTGCQGPCKQAPVLSLRAGKRNEIFAQVVSEQDWQAVLSFAEKVRQTGTLLTNAREAEKFRFDPVHHHDRPGAHLQPLEFLLGHFRGEGKYAMTAYSFQKELIGTMEAGGRFLALRMDVAYPLTDGRQDIHKALVIAGAEALSGKIAAHAYTDGGIVREYSVQNRQDWFEFEDQPPGHEASWTRARKILQPTDDGFEERLEVDRGDGNFIPYYVIPMKKVRRA